MTAGVKVDTVKPGDGKNYPTRPGQIVHMHYTGRLESGKVFDSSVARGQPFVCRIGAGELIKGWDVGVPQMSLGEKVSR